ncbi:putative phosphatase [Vibrio phage RYC]|nr:putative phosphatase [Vibrio phage RYC]
MLVYKKGNAVSAKVDKDCQLLLHVANCQGKMASGIAKEIRERVPEAYNVYKEVEEERGLTLGTVSSAKGVVNLHAQKYYGYDGERYLDYEALAKSLERVKEVLDTSGIKSGAKIAVPHLMGCDRAGGAWKIVEAMLEHYLGEHQINIYSLK